MLLHLAEAQVRPSGRWTSRTVPSAASCPTRCRLSPGSGVVGTPSTASAVRGADLLEPAGQGLAELLAQARAERDPEF